VGTPPKENKVQTIHVTQSKGGAGASTFRVALALVAAREGLAVALVGDQEDHAAICGLAASFSDTDEERVATVDRDDRVKLFASYDHYVREIPNVGANFDLLIAADEPSFVDTTLLVTRGCYLAFRHATRMPPPDGIVMFIEPGRSLGARDATNVIGAPVVGSVAIRASVARAIDAGVFPVRMPVEIARPAHEVLRRVGAIEARTEDTASA
jgi:hypothetical protein